MENLELSTEMQPQENGEFPLRRLNFRVPKWVETLDNSHWLKEALFASAKTAMSGLHQLHDVTEQTFEGFFSEIPHIKNIRTGLVNPEEGSAEVEIFFQDSLYYEILSEMTGTEISSEYQLISLLREMSAKKIEYGEAAEALRAVRQSGYAVISPGKNEIEMSEPMMIRQGNRYGVKIKAEAPSIHLIRADVITEVAPIVGSEEQAKDLISYIKESEGTEKGVYQTLIFGKSIEQLIEDEIHAKLSSVNGECQAKLQNTLKRIVNESKGRIFVVLI